MPPSLRETLDALAGLEEFIRASPAGLDDRIRLAGQRNAWFTPANCRLALTSVADQYLRPEPLEKWLEAYPATGDRTDGERKRVGVIAAGNLPLVGFHDVLCVLVSGHDLLLKVSGKDDVLLPYLLEVLQEDRPDLAGRIQLVDRLKDFDAVIATGNDNSARYFEYYFGQVPHIIRKNRNSVAVLQGSESRNDLDGLAADVFTFFGLGCRNVSKLYLPEDYDIDALKVPFEAWREIFDHHLYRNNLDYHRTILLMNNIPFHDIDIVNITHNPSIASPIGNLHYEYYPDLAELENLILFNRRQIQCIVGTVEGICTVPFGEAQHPALWDYADGVDTLAFLDSL